MQYLHIARHGMANHPDARFQSVGEVLARLQENDDGRTPIECPLTLVKRVGGAIARWVDRYPVTVATGMVAGCGAALTGLAMALASAGAGIFH